MPFLLPKDFCHFFFFYILLPPLFLSKDTFKRPTHDYFSSPSPFEVSQCLLREASDVTHRITIKNECLRAVGSCGPHWSSSGGSREEGPEINQATGISVSKPFLSLSEKSTTFASRFHINHCSEIRVPSKCLKI